MKKYLLILLTGIVTSFFYFPTTLAVLPSSVNTKMVLALIGLFIILFQSISNRSLNVPKDVLWLSVAAGMVSVIGLIAVVYNGTQDYAYATYIVSMWVWLSAAYAVVNLMKYVHGRLDIKQVCKYIIAVCLFQCVIAQIIDVSPTVRYFAQTLMGNDMAWVESVNRLYGIGAELDTAGIRFSISLVMAACLALECKNVNDQLLYVISFLLITVLGSMIARTTYIGCVIGLVYLIIYSGIWRLSLKTSIAKIMGVILVLLIVLIPICIYLYNTDPRIYKLLRFAFEGFFNLAERGEWSLASNEKLKSMIVFPETLKTWIIGDGYFGNPYNSDPYYVGGYIEGWYMGTDIGYLRFIFYFGIIGLSAFVLFITYSARLCWKAFPDYKLMFVLIYMVGLIVWFKVSTDIFLVFALFICLSVVQQRSSDCQPSGKEEIDVVKSDL